MSYESDIYNEALNNYIKWYKENRSWKNLTDIQKSRSMIRRHDVIDSEIITEDTKDINDEFIKYSGFIELDTTNYMYLKIKDDIMYNEERLKPELYKKYKYKENYMSTLINAGLFESTIDLYYDGYKYFGANLKIILLDQYYLIKLEKKYEKYEDFHIIYRPYIYDHYSESSFFYRNIRDLDANECLLFINGKLYRDKGIRRYTNADGSYGTVTAYPRNNTESIETFEVIYIRELKHADIKLINGNMFIYNNNYKNPIPVSNIFTFYDSKLVDLQLHETTKNVFELGVQFSKTDKLELYYVREDTINDKIYYDNYLWYENYDTDYLNNQSSYPTWMNIFQKWNTDININDYRNILDNNPSKYNSINQYYNDRMLETINHNEECVTNFYSFLNSSLGDYITRRTIDVSDLQYNEYIRRNTKLEVPESDEQVDFITDMFLVKFYNPNEYIFNVYVDGIRFFDYMYIRNIDGMTYIYLKSSRVKSTSFIEIEIFKTSETSTRKLVYNGNGTNSIRLGDKYLPNLAKEYYEYRFLKVIDVTDNEVVNITSRDVSYNSSGKASVTLNFDRTTDKSHKYMVYNDNYIKTWSFDTRRKDSIFTTTINNIGNNMPNKDNFRIFKNGRELPKNTYTIDISGSSDNYHYTSSIEVTLNVNYTIYELIEIQYCPLRTKETLYWGYIDKPNKGEISLYNKDKCDVPLDLFTVEHANQYYLLNGTRLTNPVKHEVWCSKGVTVHYVYSRKHFSVITYEDDFIDNLMAQVSNEYGTKTKYLPIFSRFVASIMVGGPIYDEEDDVVDINYERKALLYYDLYQEFLKHNIIDIKTGMPDYIAIKYKGIVNEDEKIMVEATDKEQYYWMPLDGSLKWNNDQLIKMANLYYQLLDDVKSVQVLDPGDIPDDIYEKYKELFDNNVLILQVPQLPDM